MREIKFRAWDKKYNYMIKPDDIHPRVMDECITGTGKVLEVNESHSYTGTETSYEDISDERILMQYTGLKDKNGTEIYEGDIIEDWDDGPGFWEVKWDSEYGCFYIFEAHIWEKFYSDDMIGIFAEGKVIGNIFENPELLEQ